jgi:hypothetical protein
MVKGSFDGAAIAKAEVGAHSVIGGPDAEVECKDHRRSNVDDVVWGLIPRLLLLLLLLLLLHLCVTSFASEEL